MVAAGPSGPPLQAPLNLTSCPWIGDVHPDCTQEGDNDSLSHRFGDSVAQEEVVDRSPRVPLESVSEVSLQPGTFSVSESSSS